MRTEIKGGRLVASLGNPDPERPLCEDCGWPDHMPWCPWSNRKPNPKKWPFNDPSVMASLQKGIQDSLDGKGEYLGGVKN